MIKATGAGRGEFKGEKMEVGRGVSLVSSSDQLFHLVSELQ